jgi:SiaC family regulatory phosphoprotein
MNALEITPTIRTAGVYFDFHQAKLEITGNSIPENSDGFFQPLHAWIEDFKHTYQGKVTLRIFLTYFNTATIRHLILILKMTSQQYKDQLTVIWAYEKGDEEILDRGKDLAEVVKIKFVFEEVDC